MNKQKFSVYKQADGGGDVFIDGEIVVDNYVFSNYPSVTLVNGVKQITQYPVWQDTIVLEDGTILNLKDSKILSIEKKQGMKKTKLAAEVKTSDGKTLKTTADAIDVGVDLTIVAADGTESPCPDGDYTLENGDVITVAAGKVTAVNQMQLDEAETAELTAIIEKALAPFISKMQGEINDLKTKLSNIPGAASATENSDNPPAPGSPTPLSLRKSLLTKLEILRKKAAPEKAQTT